MSNDSCDNEQSRSLLLLQQHGLIDEQSVSVGLLDHSESKAHTPWFISVLFGFSGVFASILFIAFLTLILFETDVLESLVGLIVTGAILSVIGGVLFYNRHLHHSPFWNSLAFAITLAGQGYIAFALLANGIEEPLNVFILLLIQLVMTLVIPNFVYRLVSASLTLNASFYLLMYYNIPELSIGLYALITIVSHLQRYALLRYIPKRWRASSLEIIRALAYASAFIILNVSVTIIAAKHGNGLDSYGASSYNYYVAQGLLTLACLYGVSLILKRYQIKLLSALGLIAVVALIITGILSVYVSGLLSTSLIIVIAFANQQRVLLGLSIAALIGYIFWYYYQLDTSLLLKSASMLMVAIGFLLMRWLIISRYFGDNLDNKTVAANHQERQI